MSDAELNILIKARNQAKGEFDKLNKQVSDLQGKGTTSGFAGLNKKIGDFSTKFQGATGMSLGFASAAGLAGVAVSGLIKFLKSAVDETVAYATEIDNFSRLLGLSTEETSRLVQASDDLFISQETLKSGLQAATRQGIDVSIEGLKKLSEEYVKLNPGVERGEFLMKKFGRSGAEMGKLMEKGATGIQEAVDAVGDSLIITQQSYQNIMNYKRSVDNLTDAWQGFKYEIGQEVIPQLDLLLRQMTAGKDEVEVYQEKINTLNERLVYLNKYGAMAGLSQEELAAQIAAVKQELEGAQTAYSNSTTSLYGLAQAAIPASAYMSELTTQLLYNQAAAGLDSEAALALAEAMGLVNPETQQAMEILETYRLALDSGKITLEQYTAAVQNLNASMIDKTATYTTIHRDVYESTNLSADQEHNAYIGLPESHRAAGGPSQGLTWVGERGPELLNLPPGSRVYSNQQSMGMAVGGGPTVIVNYSPAISLTDRTEVMTKLKPMILDALRGI